MAHLTINVGENIEPPIVHDNSVLLNTQEYTFTLDSFIKDFVDPEGGTYDNVTIKELIGIDGLQYDNSPILIEDSFPVEYSDNFKFTLAPRYSIHNGVLYEYEKDIDLILQDYNNVGLELVANTNGLLTFIDPNDLSNIQYVQGKGLPNDTLSFKFTTSSTVSQLESNEATFSIIPWENVNLKDNFYSFGSGAVDGEAGDSAYQIWLDQGNTGTEADFITAITGPTGETGAPGQDGADGTSVTILDSYPTVDELETAHPTGNPGDSYLVNGYLYVWNGSGWENVGLIQGPRGYDGRGLEYKWQGTQLGVRYEGQINYTYVDLKGATGDKGDTGDKGEQGLRGFKGDTGLTGGTGKSAYQIWIDLGNTGNQQAFIDSLKGETGNQGPQGLSTYQLWLNEGNSGTIAQFIASLKGDKGDKGEPGEDATFTHNEYPFDWFTGDSQIFTVPDATTVTDVYVDGKRAEKTNPDNTPDEWTVRSATEIEILVPLNNNDRVLIVENTKYSSTENINISDYTPNGGNTTDTAQSLRDDIDELLERMKVLPVETVPTTGEENILYAENSTKNLKVWNGTSYDIYGGGSITYQDLIDALGYTPANNSEIIKGIRDSEGNLIAPNSQREVTLPDVDLSAINSELSNHDSRITVLENKPEISLIKQVYTAPSAGANQVITLDFDYFQIDDVKGRVGLLSNEYDELSTNQIRIIPELEAGEVIEVQYWKSNVANSISYTKSESDAKNQQTFEALKAINPKLSFTTEADAQAYWAGLTQTEKDEINLQEFSIETGENEGINKWDSSQPNGTDFLRELPISPNEFLNSSPINLNSNNKWTKDLIRKSISETSLQQPHTFVVVNLSAHSLLEQVSESNPFNYDGNYVNLQVNEALEETQELRVVVPTSGIKTGEKFKFAIELMSSNGSSIFFSSIANNSITNIAGKTVVLAANVPTTIVFDCEAINDSDKYIWRSNLGSYPLEGANIKIGRVSVVKGDLVSLNSPNTDIEADFISRGLIGENASPRNLLDINRQENEISFLGTGVTLRPPLNIWYSHTNPAYTATDVNAVVEHIDASLSAFDYEGNTMKIKLPDNTGHFFYLLFSIDKLNEVPQGEKLYLNFEVYSDVNVTVGVRAVRNTGTIVGNNLGDITITPTPQVLNLEIDRNLVGADDWWIGARMIVSANAFGNNIYIGRVVVSDVSTLSVNITPTIQNRKTTNPFKYLEIGDSKVEQQQSAPKFALATGNWFSTQEIDSGKNGYAPMGVGGTRIIPTSGNINSIYMRANDAHQYNADVITIYGGANDPRSEFVGDGTWKLILGSIEDEPYTGDGTELDFAGYRAYWQNVLSTGNRDNSSPYDVTFSACYQGIIKKLFENQPDVKVAVKTVVIWSGGRDYQLNVWSPMNQIIREIAIFYGCPIIDAANDSGINLFNAANYMDGILVHENSEGGKRISEVMIQTLG